MDETPWSPRRLPSYGAFPPLFAGRPTSPAELTTHRAQVRAAVLADVCPDGATEDDVDRLLLIVEELGSNGLRHGQPPVSLVVTCTGNGWLVEVCDQAVDRPPTPAAGRDAASGGLGLHLVARLCGAHGWDVSGGTKHVWGRIDVLAAR